MIDDANNGVPKHLGQIADAMYEWEGRIADELGLSLVDVADIKLNNPTQLRLQTYVQLLMLYTQFVQGRIEPPKAARGHAT